MSEALAALVTGGEFSLPEIGQRSLKGLPGEWRLRRVAPAIASGA